MSNSTSYNINTNTSKVTITLIAAIESDFKIVSICNQCGLGGEAALNFHITDKGLHGLINFLQTQCEEEGVSNEGHQITDEEFRLREELEIEYENKLEQAVAFYENELLEVEKKAKQGYQEAYEIICDLRDRSKGLSNTGSQIKKKQQLGFPTDDMNTLIQCSSDSCNLGIFYANQFISNEHHSSTGQLPIIEYALEYGNIIPGTLTGTIYLGTIPIQAFNVSQKSGNLIFKELEDTKCRVIGGELEHSNGLLYLDWTQKPGDNKVVVSYEIQTEKELKKKSKNKLSIKKSNN